MPKHIKIDEHNIQRRVISHGSGPTCKRIPQPPFQRVTPSVFSVTAGRGSETADLCSNNIPVFYFSVRAVAALCSYVRSPCCCPHFLRINPVTSGSTNKRIQLLLFLKKSDEHVLSCFTWLIGLKDLFQTRMKIGDVTGLVDSSKIFFYADQSLFIKRVIH